VPDLFTERELAQFKRNLDICYADVENRKQAEINDKTTNELNRIVKNKNFNKRTSVFSNQFSANSTNCNIQTKNDKNAIISEGREIKIKEDMKTEIVKKLISKFNVESVLTEIKDKKIYSILEKMKYICNKLTFENKIDLKEFTKLIEGIGLDLNKYEISWIFNNLDDDMSGKVSSNEVTSLVSMFEQLD